MVRRTVYEKLFKEKIDKLKSASKNTQEDMLKKLKKSNEKMKALQKDFKSTQKRKTVTFRVKKSG